MRFLTFVSIISAAFAFTNDIAADSPLGMQLLSQARLVAENNNQQQNNQNQNNNKNQVDYSWMAGYSIKFQGCNHISQWNEYANEDEDVRISTKRLIRFRLCPADSCTSTNAAGCKAGYGDYVVDMNTFLYYYMQNQANIIAYNCNYATQYVCPNKDGAVDSDCMTANNYDYCITYYNGENVLQVENYMKCAQFKLNNNNNNNNNKYNYYLGPYCAAQGGQILLGMFSDDTCTTFVDAAAGKTTFQTLSGSSLPYSEKSLIGSDCVSCRDAQDMQNQNAYDVNDGSAVKQVCTTTYEASGKCETRLAVSSPNNNACTYIEGIKITRQNGVIFTAAPNKSKVASAFIGIFCVSFILIGAYVYYLKSKLDRVKVNLSD